MISIKINKKTIKCSYNLVKKICPIFCLGAGCSFVFGLLAQRHESLCVCSSRNIYVVNMYAPCLCGGGVVSCVGCFVDGGIVVKIILMQQDA
jgi:hypothetical protein